MKLYIELSEEDVQIKIDELLGKRISSLTDKYIESKVTEIVDKKIDRLDIEKLIKTTVKEKLKEDFGTKDIFTYDKVYHIVRQIAVDYIHSHIEKHGLK